MPKKPATPRRKSKAAERPIEQYEHPDKQRANNPHVGIVTAENDPDGSRKRYAYDPHLDPSLQWAGKAEHTSFEVPTVSLHVHERIDPKTILEAVRKQNGAPPQPSQLSLFAKRAENPPLREALDFYRHPHGWSNRLVAGDSLLVMNSLLEKEGMAGKVQMVYIDPPYGIDYGSNFQPFVNKRTVKDRDEDLTQEPEMVCAFRDTWSLGIHSYLAHLCDRIKLALELLHPSGSLFVQIGDENVHLVRILLDELMRPENFMGQISFRKKMMPLSKKPGCEAMGDYLVWYAKSKPDAEKKIHQLFLKQEIEGDESWKFVEEPGGERRRLQPEEISNHRALDRGDEIYSTISMKPREYRAGQDFNVDFDNRSYPPPGGSVARTPDGVHSWSTTPEGIERLKWARRIQADGNSLRYVLFHKDYPVVKLNASWADTAPPVDMTYVVQTAPLVVQRCILMTTDPGDLVFDPTCGSGTTVYVAEQWGRRWITCDTSRVAITLAKQRLVTALYDYYELAHPEEGVASGFNYRTVPHVKLKNIANNPEIKEGMSRAAIDAAIAKYADQETLYDQPKVDNSRARVTGPFTVEAVPAPVVKPVTEIDEKHDADASLARSGETLRHAEWRDELSKTGIRGKNKQMILFSRLEPLAGTRWLHAEGETKPNDLGADRVKDSRPQRAVLSFGPEHAPLEQRQVESAWQEAHSLAPRPDLLIFAGFQFDPEAAKDIDELTPAKASMTLLKVQMNPDLLTADLKKKRASNESFWLVGQPDVEVRRIKTGEHKGKLEVEIRGFDYYNTKSGEIESGDVGRIAVWALDPDYDGRSLFARQVFFPMAGEGEGWARLARTLRAEIDEERIEAYRGTVSLPFDGRAGQKVAVKIVDDRGIESLRVVEID